jgi:hypothetical protein
MARKGEGLVCAIALVSIEAACSTGTVAMPGPRFSQVYEAILSKRCLPCHDPGSGMLAFGAISGNLDMSTESLAYANLVGVKARGPSCIASGLTRIVAGDAQSSLLFEKVQSKVLMIAAPCGDTMPDDATTLSQADLAMIQAWIDDGANR